MMNDEAKPTETSDAFLQSLSENLKIKAGVDADLASILTTYILKDIPAENAVTQAKEAILKLAVERATPPKPGDDNG